MDQETQDKLAKLEKMEKAGRERARKYIEKVRADGRVQISAIISKEAYNEIRRKIDKSLLEGTRATMGTVIESLLFANVNPIVNTNVSIDVKPEPKEPEYSLFDDLEPKATDTPAQKPAVKPVPVVDQKDIKTAPETKADNMDLDRILLAIDAEGGTWAEKADKLNAKGILTKRGKPFKENNIRMAVANIKSRIK